MTAAVLSRRLTSKNILNFDFLSKGRQYEAPYRENLVALKLSTTSRDLNKECANSGDLIEAKRSSQAHLSSTVTNVMRENLNWFNHQYERIFKIDEVRTMQERVLEAESEFVKITELRKVCQEKIENYKEEIKNIRDKLDITQRQSENYLRLITDEHKLLREQLSHDAQLAQLKDREQWSLDNLSKLLRQSHELERLRQERSKYWQIISLGLSVTGGIVALMTQKVRNQNTTMKEIRLMKDSIESIKESNQTLFNDLSSQMVVLRSLTSFIADKIQEQQSKTAISNSTSLKRQNEPESNQAKAQSWSDWLLWLTGMGYMKSLLKSQ